ncbi:MAG TPA: DegQ family serine endoprotease [Anaeromyxobacter sp.]
MAFRLSRRAAALAGALALAAGGTALGTTLLVPARASTAEAAPPAPAPAAAAAPQVAGRGYPDFTAIVRQYGPAVVNVSTAGTMKTGAAEQPGPGDGDDPFFHFFRRFGQPGPDHGVPVHGVGSGFIVKPDGLILTNAHVVDGASEVTVKLTDKREFRAKVLGIDKDTDVAVIKIDAQGLPTVKVGDPRRTQVGEWVLAIGSPFGFENSATAGVVSARARSLPGEGYVPFLQTDVAVNPGNSGGPLFDLAGDVIGINSQIYTGSGGYMGISFAIPIDVAMNVEQQLVAHGHVVRGRIGVLIQDVNQSLARSFGLAKPAGALVSQVEKGSAGAAAGLKPGDVILAVNGEELASSTDLPPTIAAMKPGTTARLTIWRDRARRDVDVRIGEAKDATVASNAGPQRPSGRLGLVVRPLTPEEQRAADVEGGAVVEDVTGPAAKAGIQPGDVVVAVDGTPVTGVEQLRTLAEKAKDHVALLVQRGDARVFVPIDLG